MSPSQRAVAIVVGALVLAGVAVVAFGLVQGPVGVTPDESGEATASAEASASASAEASASISPSAPEDEATLAVLREIEEQVIALRGLPAAEIGPPDLITRAELSGELERIFEEEYPEEEQERDNVALRALGLLAPGQDVAELQLQLLGEQVLGFYDDVDKRMVVVTDAGLDAEAKLTYAHEYTHALQDAAFGLDTLETDAVGEDDRGLARTALKEGDATVTMLAWAFANLSQEELLEIGTGTEVPDTTGVPSWMVATLAFPYNEGFAWAGALAGGDPQAPDFTELDAAYDDPPASTEQIIHLDAWSAREEPIRVEVPDLAAALGNGWEEVDETPIGEATIRIMLEFFGVPPETSVEAAAGWGGDRAVVVSAPDDAFAVAWRLAWDTPADADEFVAAYQEAIDALDFPATVMQLANGEVLVAHASSEDLLGRTVGAAD